MIVDEPGSEVLRSAAGGWERRAASSLARVEIARALRRLGVELARARHAVSTVSLLAITDEVLDTASDMGPSGLRSLDAIHLASALSLGDDLGAFVAYDKRLLAAAKAAGLPAVAPN